MQRQIIRLGKQLLHGNQRNAVLARHRGRNKRVAADQLHAKSAGPLRNLKPNPPQAQNAQSLSA